MARLRAALFGGLAAALSVYLLRGFLWPPPVPEPLLSPCEAALGYALGEVDPRFDLSRDQLLAELEQASAIWNATQPKPLMGYDPSARLKLDFVYDRRQELEAQAGQYKSRIDERESQLRPELARLSAAVDDFKRRQTALNERIRAVNGRGGASPSEVADIRREQADLDREFKNVKEMEAYARSDEDAVRSQADLFNQTVKSFNAAIQDKPEQGLYESARDRITIYFGSGRAERVHTLAHELGHALGLLHTESADGIMYPKTTESLALSAADRRALAARCAGRLPRSRLAGLR